MFFQIIKFCGITAEQVAALDRVLKSPDVCTSEKFWRQHGDGLRGFDTWEFAKKLRVKSEGDGYVYELQISSSLTCFRDFGTAEDSLARAPLIVGCPRRVLDAIYSAVCPLAAEDEISSGEPRDD